MILRAKVLAALFCIESAGDDRAINRAERAYGPAQIRARALRDINLYCGTKLRLQQFLGDRPLSAWAVQVYAQRHGARTEHEALAIWNGGPNGRFSHNAQHYASRVLYLAAVLEEKCKH